MAAGVVLGDSTRHLVRRWWGALFGILAAVDLVCGPLLTFVLFNPCKSRRELVLDLGLVIVL